MNLRATSNKQHALFLSTFLLCLLFLLYKVPYGFIQDDEPLLLAIANRFTFGDAPLTDEWQTTQMVCFLTYPLVKAYKVLYGGTEGIVLAFRYIYIVYWSLTALFVYRRFKVFGMWSIPAVIYFYLFAPTDIMSMTYNVIAVGGMLVATSIAATFKSEVEMLVVGIFFAAAVLGSPYILLIYLVWSLAVAVLCMRQKKKGARGGTLPRAMSVKSWLMFTAGACFVAVLFAFFVLSRTTVASLIENLPHVYLENHPPRAIKTLIAQFFQYIWERYRLLLLVGVPLSVITMLDERKLQRRKVYFTLSVIIFVISCIPLLDLRVELYNFNTIMLPVAWLGVEAYLLTKNRNHQLFICGWCIGVLFSFCAHIASNTRWIAISMGSVVAGTASFVLIGAMLSELRTECEFSEKHKNTLFALAISIVVIAFQLGAEVYIRYQRNNYDLTTNMLDTTIYYGPYRGIITNDKTEKEHRYYYDEVMSFAKIQSPEDRLMVVTSMPWSYLAADMPCGTYSPWGNWDDPLGTLKQSFVYYKLHPDKRADCILIFKYDPDVCLPPEALTLVEQNGYTVGETDISYRIVDE
ncbi:MAG: hypothetical protein RR998_00900 [Oscillospiraceae bacterium]